MSELGTWYAAIPIAKRDDGRFMCDYTRAIECQSAEEAVQIAAIIARKPGYTAAVERRQSHSAATSNRRASANTAAAAALGPLALSTGDEPDGNQ
jgi:hypothetical protein